MKSGRKKQSENKVSKGPKMPNVYFLYNSSFKYFRHSQL